MDDRASLEKESCFVKDSPGCEGGLGGPYPVEKYHRRRGETVELVCDDFAGC